MQVEQQRIAGGGLREDDDERGRNRKRRADAIEALADGCQLRLVGAVDDRQRRVEHVRNLPVIPPVCGVPAREPGSSDRMPRRCRGDRGGESIRVEPARDADLEVDDPRLLPVVQVQEQLVERVEADVLHQAHSGCGGKRKRLRS
jgi:hypothetical protein